MDQALRDEIAGLRKTILEINEKAQKEYGVKLESVERSLGEIRDRQKQAETAYLNSDQVKGLVEQLVKSSQAAYAGRFDLNPGPKLSIARSVLGSADTPELARELYLDWLASTPRTEGEMELHRLSSWLTMMTAQMRRVDADYHIAESRHPFVQRMWRDYRQLQSELFGDEFIARAFDTVEASEWVPTLLASDLIRFLEVRGGLIPAFRNFPMPSAKWEQPITTAAGKAHMFAERTGLVTGAYSYATSHLYPDGSSPTSKVTFDARTVRTNIVSTRQFVEASIIPQIEFAIQDTRDAVLRAIEDAAQNGKRDGGVVAGFDNDIGAAGADAFGVENNRHLWDGFRRAATLQGVPGVYRFNPGALGSLSNFGNTIALMGRYGTQPPSDLVWIIGMKAYAKLLTNISEFRTLEQIGTRATVLTGSVGMILGASLVISEFAREDLNEDGFFDGVVTNNNALTVVHRPSWAFGNFRGIETEFERLPGWDQDVVWVRWRGDFRKQRLAAQTSESLLVVDN